MRLNPAGGQSSAVFSKALFWSQFCLMFLSSIWMYQYVPYLSNICMLSSVSSESLEMTLI